MDNIWSLLVEFLVYGALILLVFIFIRKKAEAAKKKIIAGCAGIFLVLFAIHSWLIFDALNELKKVQKEIQALGLPVTTEEAVLEFKKNNIKPEDNAAIVFKQYAKSGWVYSNYEEKDIKYKDIYHPLVSRAKLKEFSNIEGMLLSGSQLNAGNITLIREYLEYNKNYLDAFRTIGNYKYTFFGFDSRDPYSTVIPDLLNTRRGAMVFAQKISVDVYDGKYEQAIGEFEEFHRINDVANFSIPPHFLLSAMIGVAFNGISNAAMEDLIVKPDLTVAQRLRLIKLLSNVSGKTSKTLISSYNTERMTFGEFFRDNFNYEWMVKNSKLRMKNVNVKMYWVLYKSYFYKPFFLKEQVYYSQMILGIIKASSVDCFSKSAVTDFNEKHSNVPGSFWFTQKVAADLGKVYESSKVEENELTKTCLKGLIENYKTMKGCYPKDLNELRKVAGKDIPRNIMECCDFIYINTPAGYELTSLTEKKNEEEQKKRSGERKPRKKQK